MRAGVHHQIRRGPQVPGDLLPAAGTALGAAVGVHPRQVVGIDVRVTRTAERVPDSARASSRCRQATARHAFCTSREFAERAEDLGAVVVEQLGRRHQVGGAANQIRPAAFEAVGGVVGESDRGHQRLVDVAAVVVERPRGRHRVLQSVPQVRRGVGVDVGEVGHRAVSSRSAASADSGRRGSGCRSPATRRTSVAESGERLGGRGQRLVQLDGIDLLRDAT